jgi:drug/metabolite transporter (DMT)-like permease
VGLHVVALNFGTVAVVQALGTLTLLFALPISALRYSVRISVPAWIDAGLTVAGLAVIMSLSVESSGPALLSESAGRYLSFIAVAAVALLTAAAAALSSTSARWRALLLAGGAGVAFGVSSVLSKGLIASFTEHGTGAVSLFFTGMVVVLGIAGYLLSQLSYRGAGLAAPLATVSVANPVVAAIAGIVVFDEGFRFGVIGRVVVAAAAVVMTLGVIGLARRTATPASTAAPDAADLPDVPAPSSPVVS